MEKDKIVKEDKSLTPEILRLPEDWGIPQVIDFPCLPDDFQGGLGYEMADACVITATNYVDGIGAEYFFTKQRMTAELEHLAEKNNALSYILVDMEMDTQALCAKDDKQYDIMTFICTAIPEEDFDDYDKFSPEKQATYKGKITFQETFWFDISNFFGSMNIDDDNQETENQGDDNSDSLKCPCTTATARKHAKKPRRNADNKDAKA